MDLMFKPGQVVVHLLTSEWLMILSELKDATPPGYTVRKASDYGVMDVAYFEVGIPKEDTNDNSNNGSGSDGDKEGFQGAKPVGDDGA